MIPLPASILRNHRSYECVSKSPIRYDFRAVARTIRCSVDTAKMRVKIGQKLTVYHSWTHALRDSGLSGREGDNCLKDVILPLFFIGFYALGFHRLQERLKISWQDLGVNKGDSRYEFSCTNLT